MRLPSGGTSAIGQAVSDGSGSSQMKTARMVQKLERVFSSRFTIVEIEHPPKAFATFYGIIG